MRATKIQSHPEFLCLQTDIHIPLVLIIAVGMKLRMFRDGIGIYRECFALNLRVNFSNVYIITSSCSRVPDQAGQLRTLRISRLYLRSVSPEIACRRPKFPHCHAGSIDPQLASTPSLWSYCKTWGRRRRWPTAISIRPGTAAFLVANLGAPYAGV